MAGGAPANACASRLGHECLRKPPGRERSRKTPGTNPRANRGATGYHPGMTKLEKPLKRELAIGERIYVITIAPEGLKLTLKGHRKGREIPWRDLVGGDSGAAEPNMSLEQHETPAG